MKEETYQQLREDVLSSAEAVDADVEYIGEMSNGDGRPVIRFKENDGEQLLIIAGEDEFEMDPVLTMPKVIEEVGKTSHEVNINIIPFFDITPPVEAIVGESKLKEFDDLKDVEGSFQFYKREELEKLAKDVLSENKENRPYSLEDIGSIDEAIVHDEIVAVKAKYENAWELEDKLQPIVDLLYHEIPDRFYFPFFDEETTSLTYYKEPLWFGDEAIFRSKPLSVCFDLEPLPRELKGLKEFCGKCNYALTLHQHKENCAHFINYNMPGKFVDQISEVVKDSEVEIGLPQWVESGNYWFDVASFDEGTVKLDSRPGDQTVDQVRRGYTIAELPKSGESKELAKREIGKYIEYFDNR